MATGPATPDPGTKQFSTTSLGVLLSSTGYQLQATPHLALYCSCLKTPKDTVAYIPLPKWRKESTPAQGRKAGLRPSRRMPARLRAGGYALIAAAREPCRRLSLRLRAASGDPGAPARVALRALAVSLRQVRGSRDADGGGGERRSPGTTPHHPPRSHLTYHNLT
ncbi:Pyridine Nucleotide-Disulfide Oxidoreductase Domain-Containing Protein 2 [Manis pentadactyla]|nr:Pyridine Nucleotide-Disulfide Oxidoreductase Domain-Containing Protein 2 [Manis pentadactyla]